MFEGLTAALSKVFAGLAGRKLTEANIQEGLRQVRLALLEADVHYQVVKDFLAKVSARAVGEEVVKSVTPAQQFVKVVHDELVALLGPVDHSLPVATQAPALVMLVGLQGSGKTTTAAKLARLAQKKGRRPLLVAADVRRPAAIEQLQALGAKIEVPVHAEPRAQAPAVCANGAAAAARTGRDLVILDTGGRLHIDDDLMAELEEIRRRVPPDRTYLVTDAMTGQDALASASEFHRRLGLSGAILTKMDGDARGGAALSIKSVTKVPVVYVGVSETVDGLEEFHPDRVATRILGLGDVVSLVEKAQAVVSEEEALAAQEKLLRNEFTLEDFLNQIQQIQKMGPIKDLLGMIPGLGAALGGQEVDEKPLVKMKAIIQSMTPEERRDPDLVDASRRRRIAQGSAAGIGEVQKLLKQFQAMRQQVKQMLSGGGMAGKIARFQLQRQRKKFGKG